MTIKIKYKTGVRVPAGWRSVIVTALAEPNHTGKRAEVLEVLTIDGKDPRGYTSRTGAKRQTFNAAGIAKREIGEVKIISRLEVIE